jgi:hypothetical protein
MSIEVWHAVHPTFGWSQPDRPAPVWPDGYTQVAVVATDDCDTAFSLTNHIDRSWTENPGVTMHTACGVRSTSVGDVLVKNGQAWLVSNIGFTAIEAGASAVVSR